MSSARYFTYLWRNKAWERKIALANEGYWYLDYAAGNRFRSAGVRPGSVVFIVTVIRGSLFLGGYIAVEAVLDRADAVKYLGLHQEDLWPAKEFIVARSGSEFVFRGDLKLGDDVARALRFSSRDGDFVYPKLDHEGMLDRQTLRNVRQLFPGAEKPLLDLLQS